MFSFSFFFGNPGCSGQLTRTTTNPRTHWTPCKPSRQVRHRGDDRRARWGSNPGDRGKETLPLPLGHKPRCYVFLSLVLDFVGFEVDPLKVINEGPCTLMSNIWTIVFKPGSVAGLVQGPGSGFWPGHRVGRVNLYFKKNSKRRRFSKKKTTVNGLQPGF
jgi:hypothetical protein